MQESNKEIIRNIKGVFEEDYLIITGALEDIAKNLFIVEKTVLCWKKMPSRIFIAREKSIPGFKVSKDRLTLLLWA